jgi:predicted unusual protein kinase regulating ubiquinone biosynthesis (AarF/ABC1/UbiB family)
VSSPEDGGADERRRLIEALLAGSGEVETSRWKRLGSTAWTLFQSRDILGEALDWGLLGGADGVDDVVARLGQLKGVAMKTGQLASYLDLDLPDEVQDAMAALRTHAQPLSIDRVRSILREDLDGADALLTNLEADPMAAASIGQVHRSRLPDGTPVAVKVQYPGIREAIANDFEAGAIGPKIVETIAPGAEVQSFHDEAREVFLAECDYEREARMQTRFRHRYADHPTIGIPEVFPERCSRRVLVTELVDAPGFEAFLDADPPQPVRDEIGRALFDFYVGSLFREGIFNADPHPGNYLFPDHERLVVLDHGCVRRFEPGFVDDLARLSRAARHDDPDELETVLVDLDIVEPGRDREEIHRLIRSFYGAWLADEARSVDLDEAVSFREVYERRFELARLAMPSEFLFLMRIRFGLMSVLADLGAEANWFQLEEELVNDRLA